MTTFAAVTVDLDDTLYPQQAYLSGAWAAVADAAVSADLSLDRAVLLDALHSQAALGSDRGGIIDAGLAAAGGDQALIPLLVAAFRGYRPPALAPYPGVAEALAALRGLVPVVCITDGDPAVQRAKLAAGGLQFDGVVLSDEMGRAFRKPHPAPFLRALELVGSPPHRVVHVGDRPGKDVSGAVAVGMAAIRVRTGEYANEADVVAPWAEFPTAASALRFLSAAAA
jgi:FMN phosphatase YigB (HAD superfamily)